MKTPIVDFVKDYAGSSNTRMHMPGHKGKKILGFEPLDITEIAGADNLYCPRGIIEESEENAGKLFGAKTFYSTEGSSLVIRTMLYLVLSANNKTKPIVLAARNVHKSFVSAAALLDLDVKWISSSSPVSYHTCIIKPDELKKEMDSMPEKPIAVYITSPDYLGYMSDIKGISDVCHSFGIPLLVDNAHGSYLHFLSPSRHPIDLGADMCCDSAHKTLPAVTGTAYLHISKNADVYYCENAIKAMSLFGSTSPSYLLLQSLDYTNKLLDEYSDSFEESSRIVSKIKFLLGASGYLLVGDEPMKITIKTKEYGYFGNELAEILIGNGIIPEFYDKDFIVFMVAPSNSNEDFELLINSLKNLPRREKIMESLPLGYIPKRVMSIREAMLAKSERLDINMCCGRIIADTAVMCPPAVPIAVCGEELDDKSIELFKYYGIEECCVVKE